MLLLRPTGRARAVGCHHRHAPHWAHRAACDRDGADAVLGDVNGAGAVRGAVSAGAANGGCDRGADRRRNAGAQGRHQNLEVYCVTRVDRMPA